MQFDEIALARLRNLQINGGSYRDLSALVRHLGAVQAQDYPMACWALGVRLPGLAQSDIEQAMASGIIIRTHVLRPTWHFIPADDAAWMVSFSARRIRVALGVSDRRQGIDAQLVATANEVIASGFATNRLLDRPEIEELLVKAGIPVYDNRLSHLLMHAEQERIVCSGEHRRGRPTYRLMPRDGEERPLLSPEAAAVELARRYFTSHGPAQVIDFSWWSGLSQGAARKAAEAAADWLSMVTDGDKKYYTGNCLPDNNVAVDGVVLLPAFDEYLVGYRDRSAVIAPELNRRAISVNGVFRPLVVSRGQVVGIWSRTVDKDRLKVEVTLFVPETRKLRTAIEEAAVPLGLFFGKRVEVKM